MPAGIETTSGPYLIFTNAPSTESTCTGVPCRIVLDPNFSETVVGLLIRAMMICGGGVAVGAVVVPASGMAQAVLPRTTARVLKHFDYADDKGNRG